VGIDNLFRVRVKVYEHAEYVLPSVDGVPLRACTNGCKSINTGCTDSYKSINTECTDGYISINTGCTNSHKSINVEYTDSYKSINTWCTDSYKSINTECTDSYKSINTGLGVINVTTPRSGPVTLKLPESVFDFLMEKISNIFESRNEST